VLAKEQGQLGATEDDALDAAAAQPRDGVVDLPAVALVFAALHDPEDGRVDGLSTLRFDDLVGDGQSFEAR